MHRLVLLLPLLSLLLGISSPAMRSWLPLLRHRNTTASWEVIAAEKRLRDLAKIPPEWKLPQEVLDHAKQHRSVADDFIDNLLDEESRYLTNLDAPALMDQTANGSLTALNLTTAFCKRAAYAHQLVRPMVV
jgi:amidase